MLDRSIASIEGLRAWALEHGFKANGPDRLVAHWRSVDWVLNTTDRMVTLTNEKDGRSERFVSQTVSENRPVYVNQWGLVEGIGLSSSAVGLLGTPSKDTSMPPWFPQAYIDELRPWLEKPV